MLSNAIDHYRDLGLLIARLGFGLGFTWFHGMPKLMGGMDGLVGKWPFSALLSGMNDGDCWLHS